MTNEGKQFTDAGPGMVPQGKGPATAGSSREGAQTDNAAPGTGAAGPANERPGGIKDPVPGHRTVGRKKRTVFRKTELLGIAPPAEPEQRKKARQRTKRRILDPEGDVAFRPFEDAFRDFVCSLVERQERVYDEMLLHVADLGQQIDELGRRVEESRHRQDEKAEAGG